MSEQSILNIELCNYQLDLCSKTEFVLKRLDEGIKCIMFDAAISNSLIMIKR